MVLMLRLLAQSRSKTRLLSRDTRHLSLPFYLKNQFPHKSMITHDGYSEPYDPQLAQMMPQSTSKDQRKATNAVDEDQEKESLYDAFLLLTNPTTCPAECYETPKDYSDHHLSAILYHIERIEKHSELLPLWTLMKSEMKENQKSTVVQNKVTKMSKEAVQGMRLAVQREDQEKAELYCLGLFDTYKLGFEKKNQKDTLKIMRENEYTSFHVHAAGMIASARQSEGVSTAKNKEIRFNVWKHLLPLPKERNDEIFDSYIPLAYLVAELKQQREAKKSGYRKGQELLKANDRQLVKVFSEIYTRLDDLQKTCDSTDQLVNDLIRRGKEFPSSFKDAKNKEEPHIIKLEEAIAKRVEADMPGKIADAKLKGDLTLTEIKKMKSNHAGTIRFRCVGKLLECTYSVYYRHAEIVLDHIEKLIKKYESASSAKRLRTQEPGFDDANAEIDRGQFQLSLQGVGVRVNQERLLNILTALEKKLSSTSNRFPLTYGDLNILGNDVHNILNRFIVNTGVSVDDAVGELIALANEAPSYSDQDTCFILGALKYPCFVKNAIFEPLDIMRRSSGAPGYAMMQAAPKATGHKTNYDSSYQNFQTLPSGVNRPVVQNEVNKQKIVSSLAEPVQQWLDQVHASLTPPPSAHVPDMRDN